MASPVNAGPAAAGSTHGDRILAEARLQRYTSHALDRVGDGQTLDLTLFQGMLPEPCSSYREAYERYPDHCFPLALLSVDSGWSRAIEELYERNGTTRKEVEELGLLHKKLKHTNSFHRTSFSYLAMPVRVWMDQVWARLRPEDRNLAAFILPDRPVHYYADLDGKFDWAPEAAEAVRTEFVHEFKFYFQQQFGRVPNLSGMHWERALHPRKLSLHVHICSEAFQSHVDLKYFDSGFRHYLSSHQREPIVRSTSFLCREGSTGSSEYQSLLDPSVYYKHSILRLCGNCKPHGPILQHWRGINDQEPELSEEELLWRGLPNFALPSLPYTYLKVELPADAVRRSPGSKRKHSEATRRVDVDEQQAAVLLGLLQPYLGPQVQIRDCVVEDDGNRIHGGCIARTAWCVRRRHWVQPPDEYIHRNNRVVFECTHQTLTLRCLHPECTKHPFHLGLTPTTVKQLFGSRSAHPLEQMEQILGSPTTSTTELTPSQELYTFIPDVVRVNVNKLVCPEVEEFTTKYMHLPNSVTFFESQQGTGKTALFLHELKRIAKQDPIAWKHNGTLWVSNRRLFSMSVGERAYSYSKQNQVEMDFVEYTQEMDNTRLLSQPRIILSLESLMRLVNKDGCVQRTFQRIILDESEELHAIFHSQTMKHGRRDQSFPLLLALLKQAKQIWVADADMESTTSVRFLYEHLASTHSMAYLFNQCQTIRHTYTFFRDKRSWIPMALDILASIQQGKKIWVTSNTKASLQRLHAWLQLKLHTPVSAAATATTMDVDDEEPQDEEDTTNVLYNIGSELKLLTGDSKEWDKQQLMIDSNQWLVKQGLFVTPVLSSGVNFDQPWFDRAYHIVTRHSTTDRQVFQQWNRVRQLKEGWVGVWVSKQSEKNSDEPLWTLERINDQVRQQWNYFRSKHNGGGHLLELEYAPSTTTTNGSIQLQSTVADRGYSAVFLRNQLSIRSARQNMDYLLRKRILRAGGTIQERFRIGSTTTDQQLLLQTDRELKDAGKQAERIWSQQVVLGATYEAAKLRDTLRTHYQLPLHLPLTCEFVEQFGYPHSMNKFSLLLQAAYGGTSYLQVSGPNDQLHLLLEQQAALLECEQLLFNGLGFTNWQNFLSGREQIDSRQLETRQSIWHHQLQQIQCEPWIKVLTRKGVIIDAAQLVRTTRTILKHHLGVGLLYSRKTEKKQSFKLCQVDPCFWSSSDSTTTTASATQTANLVTHLWQQILNIVTPPSSMQSQYAPFAH